MKVAIIHYWLVTMRGGEKVIEALCELYPEADIFTHVYDPDKVSDVIRRHRVRTTFIDRLPFARRHYQKYLPLMPMALEQLDLRGYDLIISSESGPAKGVITHPGALHVCYCHSPMRYLWSNYHEYLSFATRPMQAAMVLMSHRLRQWDFTSASRVDHFIANSATVAGRIKRYYGREAVVIHPPVDVDGFTPSDEIEDYYLFVSQLIPYKRADLAVEAFNRLGRPLVVVGEGSEMKALTKLAGPNITLVGRKDAAALRRLYARCRALVFTADEDFGIVPVEAMACGRPVIALGRGGAIETVESGLSGLFFPEPTVDCLVEAVERFESIEDTFHPAIIRQYALRFSQPNFLREMRWQIETWLDEAAPGRGTGVPETPSRTREAQAAL